MDPILLYGFPMGSSMGLVAALEWLGKPYRLCRVDMLGEMRSASYARINARHETPAFITEQGELLTETMAIAAWLEDRDVERRVSFDPLSPTPCWPVLRAGSISTLSRRGAAGRSWQPCELASKLILPLSTPPLWKTEIPIREQACAQATSR